VTTYFEALSAFARTIDTPAGPLAAIDMPASGGVERTPALLVPGYTGSKEDFVLLLGTLGATGHRAVAIDQRGQFESPGPDDPAAYTVDALARDVRAVIDAMGGGPVHVVGHSFGGLVTRAAVLAEPSIARSFTLMGSGPGALTGPRVERMEQLAPLLEAGGLPAVYAAMERLAADDPRAAAAPGWLRDFLRTRFLSSSATGLAAMGDALLSEPDRVDELAACGVPVLVVHGEDDDAWLPPIQKAMAERLQAHHVVIPGAAHSPAAEAAGPTAEALLSFWRSVEDAQPDR